MPIGSAQRPGRVYAANRRRECCDASMGWRRRANIRRVGCRRRVASCFISVSTTCVRVVCACQYGSSMYQNISSAMGRIATISRQARTKQRAIIRKKSREIPFSLTIRRLFLRRTRTKRTRLTRLSPSGIWFARQFVCPRYGTTTLRGGGVSAAVLHGTMGGESDSVSSPDAHRASSTMFVDVEAVGASK